MTDRLQIAAMVMASFYVDDGDKINPLWECGGIDSKVHENCSVEALCAADALISEHSKGQSDESEMAQTIQRLERTIATVRGYATSLRGHKNDNISGVAGQVLEYLQEEVSK